MAVVLREEKETPKADRYSARAGIGLGGVGCRPTNYDMDCNRFESLVSDYFDGLLAPADAALFRTHALQCRACRSLMDDVKAAISACRKQDDLEPPVALQTALSTIPAEYGSLGCSGFEELITEFLDGFVPAQTYHRFEQHTEECEMCSTLLTGVVYAVAGCHSVHTFEEVEVAEPVLARLIAIMPEHSPKPHTPDCRPPRCSCRAPHAPYHTERSLDVCNGGFSCVRNFRHLAVWILGRWNGEGDLSAGTRQDLRVVYPGGRCLHAD